MKFGQSKIEADHEDKDIPKKDGFGTVFFVTFTTVFIAEIGDKTQLATLLLSAQSGEPYIVFIGAALALILSSLVGVLVGQWLSSILPPEKFEQLAGVMMICLSGWLVFQVTQSLVFPL